MIDNKQKTCSKCGETKNITKFRTRIRHSKAKGDYVYFDPFCKKCSYKDSYKLYKERYRFLPHVKEKKKERGYRYRANNKDKIKIKDKLYNEKNRDRIIANARNFRKTLRDEFIAAYGGKCECCGETTREFLTLEHKNGDGKIHRKQFQGATLLKDLKDRNYPTEYGILCWNCNSSKGVYGYCPHQASPP